MSEVVVEIIGDFDTVLEIVGEEQVVPEEENSVVNLDTHSRCRSVRGLYG
jgi:hypothetical protein